MPDFVYSARGPSGQKHEGVVSAQDHAAAVSELGDRGLVPLQVREADSAAKSRQSWYICIGTVLPPVGRFASKRCASFSAAPSSGQPVFQFQIGRRCRRHHPEGDRRCDVGRVVGSA